VPWLLFVAATIIQIVLFTKISQILRKPRREDFLFVLGLCYRQRKAVAQKSFAAVHSSFFPFTCSASAVSVILEFIVIKERSIINLIIAPVVLLSFNYLLFHLGKIVFDRGLIRIMRKDERSGGFVLFSNESFRKALASVIMKVSSIIVTPVPRAIRPLVRRNIIYLLRCDPFLFPLFTIAAPVILVLFMFLIGKSSSLFLDFFNVICVFVLNYYYASHLQEASVKFRECPYYEFFPRTLFITHFTTILLLGIPYILIFAGVLNVQLFSFAGIMRFFTYLLALIATMTVNCRAVLNPDRKDSDSATDFLFLIIGVGTGIFIQYWGWIFEFVTIAAVLLLEWNTVTNRKIIPQTANLPESTTTATGGSLIGMQSRESKKARQCLYETSGSTGGSQ